MAHFATSSTRSKKMKVFTHKITEFSNDFDKWKESFIAIKKSDKQWKEGRSACALAHFMCDNNGEQQIIEQVNKILLSLNDSIDHFEQGVIEYENKFDGFRGNGRIQDLAIWGYTKCGKKIYVAVEAKVDESFGNTISEELKDAKEYQKSHSTTNKINRINNLCRDYLKGNNHNELRYQLLHYLAGTTHEPNQDIYIMLVIAFRTESYDDQKGRINKMDFDAFMKIVGEQRDFGYDLSKIKPNTYACYIEI